MATNKILLDDRCRLVAREVAAHGGAREIHCTLAEIEELEYRSGFNLSSRVFGSIKLIVDDEKSLNSPKK